MRHADQRPLAAGLEDPAEREAAEALGGLDLPDGRLDGYYEAHINAWDVAAGLVLVAEAGGWCNDPAGSSDRRMIRDPK